MQPIDTPAITAAPARHRPEGVKLAVGAVFLALCAVLMAPWMLAVSAWFGAAALLHALGRGTAALRSTLHFAGETVLGR